MKASLRQTKAAYHLIVACRQAHMLRHRLPVARALLSSPILRTGTKMLWRRCRRVVLAWRRLRTTTMQQQAVGTASTMCPMTRCSHVLRTCRRALGRRPRRNGAPITSSTISTWSRLTRYPTTHSHALTTTVTRSVCRCIPLTWCSTCRHLRENMGQMPKRVDVEVNEILAAAAAAR